MVRHSAGKRRGIIFIVTTFNRVLLIPHTLHTSTHIGITSVRTLPPDVAAVIVVAFVLVKKGLQRLVTVEHSTTLSVTRLYLILDFQLVRKILFLSNSTRTITATPSGSVHHIGATDFYITTLRIRCSSKINRVTHTLAIEIYVCKIGAG